MRFADTEIRRFAICVCTYVIILISNARTVYSNHIDLPNVAVSSGYDQAHACARSTHAYDPIVCKYLNPSRNPART
jgi:hypothetical protein